MINNDHHPKDVGDLSFRLRTMSDNNRPLALEDIDLPTEDDASLRDSYTSCFSFGPSTSHQMSPLTRSPWSSYVESSVPDCSDSHFNYTGSWDTTIKVWKVSDFKCLESITAHEDAINSVVTGFDSMVFSGSTDGTVEDVD
ncbi:hypothetical protein L1887_20017 [Cichorium endivia]|nr:hypothetical protein L1887_20017 [Cichorium endivia]